jgi:hypothetical protein
MSVYAIDATRAMTSPLPVKGWLLLRWKWCRHSQP